MRGATRCCTLLVLVALTVLIVVLYDQHRIRGNAPAFSRRARTGPPKAGPTQGGRLQFLLDMVPNVFETAAAAKNRVEAEKKVEALRAKHSDAIAGVWLPCFGWLCGAALLWLAMPVPLPV